jgi:uncharacterized protein
MLVPMEISSFALEPGRNTPVVVLTECGGERSLRIAVNPLEASAIAINSLGVTPDKPLCVDLVRLVMEGLGGNLERVLVSLDDGGNLETRLQVSSPDGVLLVASSASSALALALRCDAPVLVFEAVLDKFQEGGSLSAGESLRRHVASLETLDFGRYYLE